MRGPVRRWREREVIRVKGSDAKVSGSSLVAAVGLQVSSCAHDADVPNYIKEGGGGKLGERTEED